MTTPTWYRVVIGANGTVLECTQVEAASASTKTVYYVQAIDADDATTAAALRWKQYRESQKTALQNRREGNVASGKCRCGRKPNRGFKTCQVCLDASEESKARAKKAALGESVTKPPKSIAFARKRLEDAKQTRLTALKEVETRFWKLGIKEFVAWLESEIAKIEPKKRSAA